MQMKGQVASRYWGALIACKDMMLLVSDSVTTRLVLLYDI